MVCARCWLACPHNTYWHDQLDIQHSKLTHIYNKLDSLEIHLRTLPLLDRDSSYTKFKIKSIRKRIKRKEKIISNINLIIDNVQCPQCNTCPY